MGDEIQQDDSFTLDVDLGANEDAAPATTEEAPAPVESPSGNPAWNEILDILPPEFKSQVTPHLQKWDQGVQARFASIRQEAVTPYVPFKQFVDNGVSPEELISAKNLFDQINADPVAFHGRYTAMLKQQGLLQEQAEQIADEAIAQSQEQVVEDPRIAQLAQQQQQLMQMLAQRQQDEVIQQQAIKVEQAINSEFAQIEAKTGPLPPQLRVELINRASLLTDQYGRPVSLIEALQDLQQLRSTLMAARPGQSAPRVVPGGGAPPAPVAQAKYSNEDERMAAVKAIIERERLS